MNLSPPSHLSPAAAAYLLDPDVLDYPTDWTDPWDVHAVREVAHALWSSMNDVLDFPYTVADDVIAGVPCERITGSESESADTVILHLHGGMYCLGTPEIDRVFNAPLSRATGFDVVSVDYRLAPEHPFPAALDDTLAVWATLANAGNGAIIQGRPDDVAVIQVGKTADFGTAYQMTSVLERRLSEAFLILNVRQSERTTAEEVRMTQMELEQQLGGLFSLLTVEFLVPYLNRKLDMAQKSGDIPRLPKNIVKPTIVAGINALGRGQDRDSLTQFLTVLAQTLGPEAIAQFINTDEVIKRFAASQGIDVLNLVKSMQELQAEQQQAMAQQQVMMEQQQVPQMAAVEQKAAQAEMQAMQQAQQQEQPPS